MLHPTSVFGLLVLGVFLVGLTYQTLALQYTVTAKVPAAALTVGANILDPADGQVVSARPITVTGDCPNNSYMKLYRNNLFSGVTSCVNNAFSIQTDLSVGDNALRIRDYNATDDPGPATATVHITYQPPDNGGVNPGDTPTPTSPQTPAAGPAAAAPPLQLWSDYHFNAISVGQTCSWTLSFRTGKSPYSLRVAWGDNQNTHLSVPSHKPFTISHSYQNPGYYPVMVRGNDAAGRTVSLQLVAFVKHAGGSNAINDIVNSQRKPVSSQTATGIKKWLWVAWPTYTVVSLMAVSFWLGEQRQVLQVVKQGTRLVRPRR
jgi:hypothetical protein